ncbi:ankyrin [Aspergillus novofumigatus IBT 16806]|uniref:Ankyrin n=1 Tax=Aspergillus novofumigatus (strain IBT 16806) TaxID=1392255 RepID=A0A2I1C0H3_ASPN1|nr:ankyrin [Aspergillus novofumigatus IBT 16806]PKX91101.1 ankyrin [Aspergillus novofumigatus IBT 16806]
MNLDSSMHASKLLHLPTEIIQLIVDHLRPDETISLLVAVPKLADLVTDEQLRCQDRWSYTILYYAVAENAEAIVNLIARGCAQDQVATKLLKCLFNAGFDLSAKDLGGKTPLHWVCSQSGRNSNFAEIVQLMLAKGADPSIVARFQETLLHAILQADRKPNLAVVQMVIDGGVDVNALDIDGISPLWLSVTNDPPSILHEAVAFEREKLVKRAVELGVDLSVRDHEAETALMVAARYGPDNIAQILQCRLLEHGRPDPGQVWSRDTHQSSHELTRCLIRLRNFSHLVLMVELQGCRSSLKILCEKVRRWEIFDDVFISGKLRVRKPARAFYEQVLKAARLPGQSTKLYNLVGEPAQEAMGHWNVFAYGPPVLSTNTYPDDLGTTALALMAFDVAEEIRHKTMDDMLHYLNPDDWYTRWDTMRLLVAQLYFDSTRPHIDPFTSANMLRIFYRNGRGSQLIATRHFMEDMLRTRAYEHGTRYYHLPDFFMYYLSDMSVHHREDQDLHALEVLLRQRLQERMGFTTHAPSTALRLISSNSMEMSNIQPDATNMLQDENYGLHPKSFYNLEMHGKVEFTAISHEGNMDPMNLMQSYATNCTTATH